MNRIVSFLLMLLVCQFSLGQAVKKTAVAKEVQPLTYKSSWGPINSGKALIAKISAIAPAAIIVKIIMACFVLWSHFESTICSREAIGMMKRKK